MSEASRVLGRAGALAVSGALLAVGYFGLAVPYRDYLRGLDARISAASALAERYQTLAGRAEEAAPESDALDDLLLPELSDAQATAQLLRLLQGFATANGLELAGLQPLPREDTAGLQRLSLRLRGAGDIGAVNAFLHAAETARPLLVIDNLRLQSRSMRADGRLDLQLDVSAFKARPAT